MEEKCSLNITRGVMIFNSGNKKRLRAQEVFSGGWYGAAGQLIRRT